MSELSKKRCVPCEGKVLPLTIQEAQELAQEVPEWSLDASTKKISREFTFKNFAEALVFANKVGVIAEEENHHPDLTVSWGKVGVTLSTHSIGGLSENDFILAAKIDKIIFNF